MPSPRELEAISILVVCGPKVKNDEIAWQMSASVHTVRALLRTASIKTGCDGRAALVGWYLANQSWIERRAA